MSNIKDFVIENGVLKKYQGSDADIIIPVSVTSIGNYAFSRCKNLQSITLPSSVISIGGKAFYGCSRLQSVTLPDSLISIGESAFSECSNLKSIIIPDSVTSIGNSAFFRCSSLQSITIPDSVTSIGDRMFEFCSKLQRVTLPDSIKIEKELFGDYIPGNLINQLDNLFVMFTEDAIKKYLLNDWVWKKLSGAIQGRIIFMMQSNSLKSLCDKYISKKNADEIAKVVIGELPEEASAKECKAVVFCMDVLVNKASNEIIKQMYDWLCYQKKGKKAVATINDNLKFSDILGMEVGVDNNLQAAEKLVIEKLFASNKSKDDLADAFKCYYSLTEKDIPQVTYKDGGVVSELILMWLFTIHEKFVKPKGEAGYVSASYKKASICDEAKEILSYIDEESFQSCLEQLSDKYLGISGHSKKMFLAYPICRYANEKLIVELTKRAPKWRSSASGDDAPPLRTFRDAIIYSDYRSAVMFADKYDGLKYYAEVRDTTKDYILDVYLSDIGLDTNGSKEYNLGNQKVVAKLQSDLSFLVELSNGKTAKSLPKKGADEKLYQVAKADFDIIKKDAKKIVKNRNGKLFEDFLSGRERGAEEWKNSYINNSLLRIVASLLVWTQGDNTFTIKDCKPVTADGSEYSIGAEDIKVAHPMEMSAEDVTLWQQYFVSNGIKQPFEQVWEPVRQASDIQEDRYKDCVVDIYKFANKDKHGIHSYGLYANSEYFGFNLDDCELEYKTSIWRIGWDGDGADTYSLGAFKIKEYTRKVNHIVTILDRITVAERIQKDDCRVMELLSSFTLAQITEFIRVASENNATNVQALLLEYKNNNFSNFDPMEEFTLE